MKPASAASGRPVRARARMGRGCGLALGLVAAAGAQAQAPGAFPNHPVRLVVPYAPGGNIDITGRIVAPAMSEALGVSFVVDNRAGAGGAIGSELVAKAAPDGHTLLVASTGQVGAAASAERLCAAMEARCKDCAGIAFVLPDREFIVSGVRDWLHQIRE